MGNTANPPEMDQARAAELEKALEEMRRISNGFYVQAQGVGVHGFLELTGFINTYLESCQVALLAGMDFTTRNEHSGRALPLETFQVAYLAEKLRCLFGPAFEQNPALAEVFIQELRKS